MTPFAVILIVLIGGDVATGLLFFPEPNRPVTPEAWTGSPLSTPSAPLPLYFLTEPPSRKRQRLWLLPFSYARTKPRLKDSALSSDPAGPVIPSTPLLQDESPAMASPLSQIRGRQWHDDEDEEDGNDRHGDVVSLGRINIRIDDINSDSGNLEDEENCEDFSSQLEENDTHLASSSFSSSTRHSPIPFSRSEGWLEEATETLLDLDAYPLGELTEEDLVTIGGVMSAWSRRASGGPPTHKQQHNRAANGTESGSPSSSRLQAAMSVERLLKRVVDDVRVGNPAARVSTRLYTYVRAIPGIVGFKRWVGC